MESLFLLVPVFIGAVFLLVFGVILVTIVRGVAEWSNNNRQPVLSVPARVVAKRTETGGRMRSGVGSGRVWTSYYVTFELPSGERREFEMGGEKFGLLVEGDAGTLTHQGTRDQGFQRAA